MMSQGTLAALCFSKKENPTIHGLSVYNGVQAECYSKLCLGVLAIRSSQMRNQALLS